MEMKNERRQDSELAAKTQRDTMTSSDTIERKRSSSYSRMKLYYGQNSLNPRCHDDEISLKRPRLTVDTSRETQPLCEALSSNESFLSSLGDIPDGVVNTGASGLSAYLEDIVSDEDPLLDDVETTPPPNESNTPPPESSVNEWTESSPSKEELLQMMEKVDRDITAIEQQISVLEKRQEELEKTSTTLTTPSPSTATPTLLSPPSSSFISSSAKSPEHSLVDTIYHDNRIKAQTSQMTKGGALDKFGSLIPLYYQPSDMAYYIHLQERHKEFRPKLLRYLKMKKLERHKKELSLCAQYDHLTNEWKKRLDKWEQSTKKKNRDSRNKELFEKLFPEIRTKRDQLRDQAYSTVGVRSFGVVRSEAELDQLAYELYEQDEANHRHQLTHAVLPPMILDDRPCRYLNTNGRIVDPMTLYREGKVTSSWSEEEKAIFKNKFMLFPKNFEKIASFLPNKTIQECIRYYYLAKKKEHFKQLTRRSSFKRRRQIHKQTQQDYHPLASPLLFGQTKPKPHLSSSEDHLSALPSVITSPTTVHDDSLTHKSPTRLSEYNGWTEKEIASLKEGLRRYGRAWGKVYREVGGGKSATQCKLFYDNYCTDERLELNASLAEHSAKKNAEKVKKKMAEMKKAMPLQPSPSPPVSQNSRKKVLQLVESKPVVVNDEEVSGSSREVSESEDQSSEGEESDSETTLTDSGSEDPKASSLLKPLRQTHHDSLDSTEPLQSPLDIFLSAAEALSNTVPVEVALHDHTYSRPPMDLQGSSGLQLIAAAAAVVSPSLSKTASSSSCKMPFSAKAPRGRPPSQQKRGNNSAQKLAPSYLTPTSGASHNVLLQDLKPPFRARSRSAPTEKLRPALQAQKPILPTSVLSVKGGNQLSNNVLRPIQYQTRGKDVPNLITSGVLKSMISPAIVNSNGYNGNTPVSSLSSDVSRSSSGHYSLTTTNSVTKTAGSQRKDGTVLELNLGSMALLLAATGNNQQAALLLPQSSLLNKQTLAVLQSGSTGATLNIDSSLLVSNGRSSKTDTHIPHDSIPLVTPTAPPTTQPTKVVKNKEPTSLANPLSSDDLSNLNLLSNLVAGLTTKPDIKTSLTSKGIPSTCDVHMTTSTTTPTLPTSLCKSPPPKPSSLLFRKSEEKTESRKSDIPSHRPTTAGFSTLSQQSLMLYARSLSMPLNSPVESSPDEEDHLEYATRGISELSKLLGTDNGLETPPTETPPTRSNKTTWSPDDLLCNPFDETSVHRITSSLTATSTESGLLPPHPMESISSRTPPPISAFSESSS